MDGMARDQPSFLHMEKLSVTSFGRMTQEQTQSLESWLETNLEHSSVITETEENIPKFVVEETLDVLHAHAEEAAKQLSRNGANAEQAFGRGLKETKQVKKQFELFFST